MKTKLVVIRGNKGSGKTTIAHKLQDIYQDKAIIISQDDFDDAVLNREPGQDNAAALLMKEAVLTQKGSYELIVLEGQLPMDQYQLMLQDLHLEFRSGCYFYQFDLTFEETKNRLIERGSSEQILDNMRKTWKPSDKVRFTKEFYFDNYMSVDDIINSIIINIQGTR